MNKQYVEGEQNSKMTQLAETVEYTNCISAEG